MEPFCQFFASPRDVVRAYIALQNDRLKEIAEERLGCPIISLESFFSEELNVFFWGDTSFMACKDHLYVYDESLCDGNNYMKLRRGPGALVMEEAYVQDAAGYNRLWSTLHTVFAEVCAGDTTVEKGGCRANMWAGIGWVPINIEATAVYDGSRFTAIGPTPGAAA